MIILRRATAVKSPTTYFNNMTSYVSLTNQLSKADNRLVNQKDWARIQELISKSKWKGWIGGMRWRKLLIMTTSISWPPDKVMFIASENKIKFNRVWVMI